MTSKLLGTALALSLAAAPAAAQSARIIVVNVDAPGVGFNDPTPAAPVGGNPGTTRGQQALNVFQTAANRWAANLQSKQVITVVATFTPLQCTQTGGVLGAAGANWFFRDAAPAAGGQPLEPNTWYPSALAEKRTRLDLSTAADPDDPFDIFTLFNSQLGVGNCLVGSGWYFGLDNNQPSNLIDLLSVVMHEFGHGLGVSVGPTRGDTGVRGAGLPSVWESRMLDLTTGKRWIDMTNAERAASARNTSGLVWAGQQVTNVVPSVLGPALTISGSSIPTEDVQAASFGPAVTDFTGNVVAPLDGNGSSLGCAPYGPAANTAGNVVLVDRGLCNFTVKVKNAQNAGAVAVLVANNASGLPSMGGADATITIPSWGVSQAVGTALKAAQPTSITIASTRKLRAGTSAGYARLFAPNPFQGGSSVSHFDTTLTPSVLMEPSITPDLTVRVKNPFDLTLALLRDIGW